MIETIQTCLDQKIIFAIRFLDFTKQMEVRIAQEEVVLDELIAQRGECISRIKKCDKLIQTLLEKMDSQQKERIISCLSMSIDQNLASLEEKRLLDRISKYSDLMKRAKEIDDQSTISLKEKCQEAKMALINVRKKQAKVQ